MPFMNQGRRRFLQSSALASASLVVSSVFPRSRARANDESVDALIIGSGFGGAVAALRLGQAGINTVVLERGRRWKLTSAYDTFATFRNPDGRVGWLTNTAPIGGESIDVYTGVLERVDANGISIFLGAGVGGGSLNYYATTFQPPKDLFYKSFPSSVSYDELDETYYPRVRSVLKASTIPQDILASDYYLSSRVFIDQAVKAGLPYRWNVLNVNWEIVRQQLAGTVKPDLIIGEGVDYGCNSGAKNSLDLNYLRLAEETGYVEILPLHVATEISQVPGYGYRVSYNEISDTGSIIASKSITCRYLFLAAGSIGTSKLLVKAKAKGTLPWLNEHIGQGWGSNGDTFSTRSGLPDTNPGKGGPGGSAIVEHPDNPFGPTALNNAPDWQAPQGSLRAICETIPSARGSFKYDWATDSVTLDWPVDSPGVVQSLKAAEYTHRLLDKRNTTISHKPKTEVTTDRIMSGMSIKKRPTSTVSNALTVHALGGAVMDQACDTYGRVKNYQGLYVVDGALIPGCTGTAAPSLTIAAIAERCLDKILAEDILHG
ncbi:cholesterol oxidase [Nostoc sp. NIES-4103]|nr:cholesterol oxidase [Nostoc sp. NIES-4103]